MSTEKTQCPKCNGEMVQGFIGDWGQGGGRRVSSWVEGAPEKSFWHGTNAPEESYRSSRDLPLCGVRLPRVLCTSGIQRQVRNHVLAFKTFPTSGR